VLTAVLQNGGFRASIRQSLQEENLDSVFVLGDLMIDLTNHTVKKNDELVKLTSTEFSLLELLAKNEGRVLTHQFILKEIWGMGYTEQTQYLRFFIAQLRKKIEDDSSKPRYINTESGVGYRFGQ
jgi:two-component system KDP operon response regulator KdpE